MERCLRCFITIARWIFTYWFSLQDYNVLRLPDREIEMDVTGQQGGLILRKDSV